MANTWILIRHPDKEGDAEGMYLGDTARISERGQAQIACTIARLRMLHPDAILSSFFPRAQELAKRIAEDLQTPYCTAHAYFNEIDKPRFLVGMRRNDPEHERVMQAIRDGFDQDTVPTHFLRGEVIKSRRELEDEVRRTFQFIEQYATNGIPAHTVLTVGHAKRIAAYVHWVYENEKTLKEYYKKADRNLKISTTGITILTREPDRRTGEWHWHVERLNDNSHTEVAFDHAMREMLGGLP